jgi:hypothetical protein
MWLAIKFGTTGYQMKDLLKEPMPLPNFDAIDKNFGLL